MFTFLMSFSRPAVTAATLKQGQRKRFCIHNSIQNIPPKICFHASKHVINILHTVWLLLSTQISFWSVHARAKTDHWQYEEKIQHHNIHEILTLTISLYTYIHHTCCCVYLQELLTWMMQVGNSPQLITSDICHNSTVIVHKQVVGSKIKKRQPMLKSIYNDFITSCKRKSIDCKAKYGCTNVLKF